LGTSSFDILSSLGTSSFHILSSLGTSSFHILSSLGTSSFDILSSLGTSSFDILSSLGTSSFVILSSLGTSSFVISSGDSPQMPLVFIAPERMWKKPMPHVSLLQQAGFDLRYPDDPTFTHGVCGEAETIAQLQDCDAIIAGGENFTPNVLAKLPKMRVIARCGVGYDRVNIPAATEKNIAVTITPNANAEGVAEHAFALLLGVAKNVAVNDQRARQGWQQELTAPVRGTTLGILGLGRIGREVAIRGRAFGMQVLATESFPDQEFVRSHDVTLVDFDRLVRDSDYLSIHCPLNDQTRELFNADVFARMKPGSVLINTARGGIIDEPALVQALESGCPRAAGLDVCQREPPLPDNPLLRLSNVILSPHLAGEDRLSLQRMGVEAANCIIALYRGQWPEGAVVNEELRGSWQW
jgi:phosphoglycerate dehydrogenase-like enzyme